MSCGHSSSEVEDKAWFYDRDYCAQLSFDAGRITGESRELYSWAWGTTTAGSITDGYFVFPYPFFVAVPGYEGHGKGTFRERSVRIIYAHCNSSAEEAARRGMRFPVGGFGHWPIVGRTARTPTYPIEGLTDDNQAAYCRDALSPRCWTPVLTVIGVTFRVHEERHSNGAAQLLGNSVQRNRPLRAPGGNRSACEKHGGGNAAIRAGHRPAPQWCLPKVLRRASRNLPYHPALDPRLRNGRCRSIDRHRIRPAGGKTGRSPVTATQIFWPRIGPGDVVFRVWPGTQRFFERRSCASLQATRAARRFAAPPVSEWPEPLFSKDAWAAVLRAAAVHTPLRNLLRTAISRNICTRTGFGGGSATTRTQIPKCGGARCAPSSAQRRRQSKICSRW